MKTSKRLRARRICVLALLILPGLSMSVAGCGGGQAPSSNAIPPFVFRSLDLSQRRADGSRDWDLQSPEARYSLDSRSVRAINPRGVLYRNDQPSFAIQADLATVLNDGELVILEGGVALQQLNQRQIKITGERLLWSPSRSQMVIDETPRAVDATSELSADHLTFDTQRDTLSFLGTTLWKRWTGKRSDQEPPNSRLTSGDGTWNLATGALQSDGPVRLARLQGETLTASRLQGNTLQQHIDLLGPVEVTLPRDQGQIKTGLTRWDFGRQLISTQSDALATLRNGTARGRGLEVDQRAERLTIPAGCELVQPDQRLTAQRCSWSWSNDTVVADGDVVLRRMALDQVTRAPRLEGVLNDAGVIRFGAPGQRVRSTLKLKSVNPADGATSGPMSF
ncbi:MAG: LPS export ABC transporter periplasmic protein LptC [Synechococcus sp.]